MAFRGIFPAHDLVPTPCGLLSAARVTDHKPSDSDERWIRGFSHEVYSDSDVQIFTVNDETVGALGVISDTPTYLRYKDYKPFFIQVTDTRSSFGLTGEDRFALVLKQLEAATQKAVERELWEGAAALAESNSNLFLRKSSTSTVVNAGALAPGTALMLLEQAISDSPLGLNGVIHMTRDVASILGSKLIYIPGTETGPGRVMTRSGTAVVIGSGYTGSGRIGDSNTAASASNKWMFATGAVDVHLGKSEVVNEDLSQGFTASSNKNDLTIRAVRPAAVYFDPTINFTVRLALPTT